MYINLVYKIELYVNDEFVFPRPINGYIPNWQHLKTTILMLHTIGPVLRPRQHLGSHLDLQQRVQIGPLLLECVRVDDRLDLLARVAVLGDQVEVLARQARALCGT